MKYLILVPDGSADRPGENALSPLEEANIPNMDGLARRGEIGLVRTIPEGIPPASDAANLAVMGYDPVCDLTGRSPLEAVSMGIEMSDEDVAFRTNLVTLRAPEAQVGSVDFDDLVIVDHSAGDISNEEAKALIEDIDAVLGAGKADTDGRVHFYPGVSYRHALIISPGEKTAGGIGDVASEAGGYRLTPPHDILERRVGDYMPKGEGSAFIADFMRESYRLLQAHPINLKREKTGRNPGNAIWIWGQGKRPNLATFRSKFGIEGSVVSAVDLIKGIGICAGLDAPSVAGATGTLDTNFSGKAEAAIDAFKSGRDFVYVHVEAPDECSHQGNRAEKIMAIERIDADVLCPVLDYLAHCGEDYRILIVPDHRTPLEIRTHSDEPVPYVLFDSRKAGTEDGGKAFSERAGATGRLFESGQALAEYFFGGS